MAFQLDTSGAVWCAQESHPDGGQKIGWPDLSPFTQGYVEALFASMVDQTHTTGWAFRYLAPATLERIMADCARALATSLWGNSNGDGRLFWSECNSEAFSGFFGGRQDELIATFPPLAPYLGDDGLIYLRDVPPEQDPIDDALAQQRLEQQP